MTFLSSLRGLQPRTLLALAVLLTLLAYWPGLYGAFMFDDFHVIVRNAFLQTDEFSAAAAWQAALSSKAGPLYRPLAMLSFWLNYQATGLQPFWFKLTGALVHAASGVALYFLTRSLLTTRSLVLRQPATDSSIAATRLAATLAATLWLLHPLNLTSVLLVTQRMTSLAALFTVLGLIVYLKGRCALEAGHRRGVAAMILGPALFGALAVMSKETGFLMGAYLLVIEFAWLGMASDSPRVRRALIWTYAALAGLAVAVVAAWLDPSLVLASYARRDFTLVERLLTEARVLWTYVAWIFAPVPGQLGIFHDDIGVSRGLLQPVGTLVAIAGWVLALAGAIVLRKRHALAALAVLWFLAGHLMESTFIGLEIAHEHRNYLPGFGPMFLVAGLLARPHAAVPDGVRMAAALLCVAALGTLTAMRAVHWGSPDTFYQVEARHHPESSRANNEAGRELLLQTLRSGAVGPEAFTRIEAYLVKAAEADRSSLTGPFTLVVLYRQAQRDLPEWLLPELRRRLAGGMATPLKDLELLVKLLVDGSIVMPERDVISLFEAALENPRSAGATQATLFVLAATYYGQVQGNAQEAVSLSIAATQADPYSVAHRLNLAEVAIRFGNLPLAHEQIEAATRLDRLNQYGAIIARTRDKAAAASHHP